MEKFIQDAQSVSDWANHNIIQLCSVFESNRDVWAEAYEKAPQNLHQNPSDDEFAVSKAVNVERKLPAFCFARLVELFGGEIEGDGVLKMISQELELTQEWDDEELEGSFARPAPPSYSLRDDKEHDEPIQQPSLRIAVPPPFGSPVSRSISHLTLSICLEGVYEFKGSCLRGLQKLSAAYGNTWVARTVKEYY